ncbi:MAG: MFS transporter [Candidatus Nanopelagicales bacterium]|nr:MFS transporter [Candidatus Nanopelagicales bacterium]MDP4986433.1 MFS transporter [Candidatus Nanopelagicales bacterium]MDP5107350.1 MFS transporter [Candidatus Nanopelagicales bacterium]
MTLLQTLGRKIRHNPWLRGLPNEVAVLSLIAFFVAIGFGIVAPAIPVFARSFGVSALAASSVVSVFALMRFASAPLAGFWVNRFGERIILTVGLLLVSVSSFFAGLADNFNNLIILRGIGGLGSTMFTVSAFSLLLRIVAPEKRGRAAAAFQGGFLVGGLAGPAVGGIVIAISLRAPFFVYSFTLLLAAASSAFFLKSHDKENVEVKERSKISASLLAFTAALKNKAYTAALSVNLATGFVSFGIRSSIIPLFVVEQLKSSPSLIMFGFLATSITQAIFLSYAGKSTDIKGRRPSMIWGTFILFISIIILVAFETPLGYLISMAIAGVGAAFMGAAPAAVIGDVTGGKKSGPVVAAFQMTSDFGSIVGPIVAGALVDSLGFGWAFMTGAAVSLVAIFFSVIMPETKPKDINK